MKICWDTLEGMYLSKAGYFVDKYEHRYIYKESCNMVVRSFKKSGLYL